MKLISKAVWPLAARSSCALILTFILMIQSSLAAAGESVKAPERISFRVFLNDREIGTHVVTLEHDNDAVKVGVEANFDIRIMGISVFRYYHTASELWRDSCLLQVDTLTKKNKEELSIKSKRQPSGLLISSPAGEQLLDGCVRSYAYWDPNLLSADKLLNTQTGEYQTAHRAYLGEVNFEADAKALKAHHYRLTVSDKQIDLWYSDNKDWLALETTVKGGRNLAYRREI